ncbi:MAG: HNH endonuclease [Candidatus Dadabacteria bacterium]
MKVYEKIYPGIWVFNGYFNLVDTWKEKSGNREVFKFRLVISDDQPNTKSLPIDLEQNRLIPSKVKLEVWKRDGGACVRCGKKDNLHFDHIIPYSKGGTSLTTKNIQLLCARHNLEKLDKIQ